MPQQVILTVNYLTKQFPLLTIQIKHTSKLAGMQRVNVHQGRVRAATG